MKRFITLALAIVLVLSALPFTSVAQEGPTNAGKTAIIYTANLRGDITLLPQIATVRYIMQSKGFCTVLLDTGNYLQGTIYSAYDSGRSVIELMYKTGYDVIGVGAREFDFGTGQIGVAAMHGLVYDDGALGDFLEDLDFAVVASNIVSEEELFLPNAVVTTENGLNIGVFALTDPNTVYQVLESNLAGITFENPGDAAVAQVQALAGNDLIIGLSNVGIPMVVPGALMLDVTGSAGFSVNMVIICQEGRVLSHSSLTLSNMASDEEIAYAVAAVQESANYEFPTFAHATVTLEGRGNQNRSAETNTGNLWTDALRWFATTGDIINFFDEDDIDAGNNRIMVPAENVVAIWNGGNLRDFLHPGHVTLKDVQRVLPFPNRVAVMYLTGAQLLELLEAATQALPMGNANFAANASFPHVSGIEFTVDATIPFAAGEAHGNHWFRATAIRRVTIDYVNGQPFDPAATYAVITSNAIFNGMDSNYISLERCPDYSTITSAFVVDVVWNFIMQELGGVIDSRYATPHGRITILQ